MVQHHGWMERRLCLWNVSALFFFFFFFFFASCSSFFFFLILLFHNLTDNVKSFFVFLFSFFFFLFSFFRFSFLLFFSSNSINNNVPGTHLIAKIASVRFFKSCPNCSPLIRSRSDWMMTHVWLASTRRSRLWELMVMDCLMQSLDQDPLFLSCIK